MSACREFQRWWRTNVLIPVLGAMTTWVRACREYRQTVRREVSRPMEQWVSQAQQTCNSWPWPFNWFCTIVVTVIRIVVWVVEVIVEWVVAIVCELLAVVVQIVLRIISMVVEFVVSFFVCLFTDFEGWLNAWYELYLGLLDIVESVIDLVGSLLDAVLGIVESLGYLLEHVVIAVLSILPVVGELLGRAIAGLIHFVFGIVRRVIEIVRDVIDHAQDIVFGLLRLDMCRLATGAMGLGTDVLQILLLVFNLPLGWLGGVRDSYVAGSLSRPPDDDNLSRIIDERLVRAFAGDPEGLQRARTRVRMSSRPMGLPVLIVPWRFYLDSRSPTVDLGALHNNGQLNLYTAIGGPNVCDGRTVLDFAHWEAVYAGTQVPVTRRDIDFFLSDGPTAVPPFRVYAVELGLYERHLEVARRKGYEIGIEFTWSGIHDYPVANADEFPFEEAAQSTILTRFGRTGGGVDDLCQVPALAIHRYLDRPTGNGLASWFRPPADSGPSGVSFRDRTPEYVFRWVLIHELGHYFGLDHTGHSGLEHIMYTNDPAAGLSPVTGDTVAEYIVFSGEPHFTLDDARRVWDWLTTTAIDCVRG